MQTEKALILTDVSFAYGKNKVLNKLNLQVEKGQVHGILGDNGAGKSTLFNLLFGNISPNLGHLIYGISNKDIAYLSTESYFYRYMTGFEYLSLVSKYNKEAVNSWNEIFCLPLQDYAYSYSTGMKKQLSLLGILLLNKNLLILDEPFNGLDLGTADLVSYIIDKLREAGKTIILSSHILAPVLNQSDAISFLETGNILHTYPKKDFNTLASFMQSRMKQSTKNQIDLLLPQK